MLLFNHLLDTCWMHSEEVPGGEVDPSIPPSIMPKMLAGLILRQCRCDNVHRTGS